MINNRNGVRFGVKCLFLFSVLVCCSGAGPANNLVQRAWFAGKVNPKLEVERSSVSRLNFVADDQEVVTSVTVEDQVWTIRMRPHSIRSADFRVLVQDASGALIPVEAPPSLTYKGTIDEVPGAEVRGSFKDNELSAVVYSPSGTVYGIQPLSRLGIPAEAGAHAVYKDSDWNGPSYSCGSDHLDPVAEDGGAEEGESGSGSARGTGLKIADIGLDADFEFYQLNGSNLNNTVQDMENVINGVETIYETETQITYEITTVIVRTTEPDPYTSTDPVTLLENQFRANWLAQPQSFIRRDTAHLFTGKNINGGVIGIAYLNGLCSSSIGYGLSQSRFSANFASRVALTAHELGHNWSAPHCDDPTCPGYPACCRIMCSGLGGCSGQITSFGTFSANQIIAFRNSRSCLSDQADTQFLPFFEDFPATTLDTTKWSYNNGGVINTNAMNEPSAPNAMELDAEGSQLYRDNDLRTNFINLVGETNVLLSYSTQHRGVENGEQLVVEYWQSARNWVEINRITSDGVDQTDFELHAHVLPANASHIEFRVRFRPEVDENNDDWFLDNVGMTNACTVDSDCEDSNPCTDDACVATACQWTNNTLPCDDATICNGLESCSNGSCTSGTPLDCEDHNTCTDDSCDAVLGCQNVENVLACNDGDACTAGDLCDSGVCAGTPFVKLYGDVSPQGGDDQIELSDILCLTDGYNVFSSCPDGDIWPCPPNGDRVIEIGDILAGLDTYSGNPPCPDPCPP